MTISQIKYIIEKWGYKVDTWETFEDFSMIIVEDQATICPSKKTRRIRINTDTEMLEVVSGLTSKGVFISNYNETENYTPNYRIKLSAICDFIQTTGFLENGMYVRKI